MPSYTRSRRPDRSGTRALIERPACLRSVRRRRGQHHRHERVHTESVLRRTCDPAPGVGAPAMTIRHDRSSDRSPLHDVRKHVLQASQAHNTNRLTSGRAFVEARRAKASLPNPTGGARRDRTDDLLLAKQALSQLSYGPSPGSVISNGLGGPGKI